MSSQRGNNQRTRPQKHKNRTVFKNDLHDKTPQQKKINALNVSAVCMNCKSVIEWKIKYKVYKPLTQPKNCTKCHQRKVKQAYHVICRDCALESKKCAKCLKSAEEVQIQPAELLPEEQQKVKVEMNRHIKSLPERKRRTFLRYMEKGKKAELLDLDSAEKTEGDEVDVTIQRIPHTREELLAKIEQLKDSCNDELDFYSDDEEDNDDYDDGDDDDDDTETSNDES